MVAKLAVKGKAHSEVKAAGEKVKGLTEGLI
jgi:hypothetical protein